jgi:hypothetical protein
MQKPSFTVSQEMPPAMLAKVRSEVARLGLKNPVVVIQPGVGMTVREGTHEELAAPKE